MSKKKKVAAPVYQTMKDDEYITGLRQDLPTYRNYYNTALGKLNYWSPEYQQDMMNLARDFTGSEWNDLNRGYLQTANELAQRNYQRMGGMNNTGSLVTTDALGRQYNDLASRLAAQTANYFNTLKANEYNQRLASAQLYGNAYDTAGGNIYAHDQQNWNIGNRNIEAKYVADVQNANRKGGIGDALIGGVTGAAMGFMTGGPPGALIGGVGGALNGGFGGDIGNSASLGAGLGNLTYGKSGTWLGNKLSGLNLGSKAGQIISSPNTFRTFANGAYAW